MSSSKPEKCSSITTSGFKEIGDGKAESEFGPFKFFHPPNEAPHPLIQGFPGKAGIANGKEGEFDTNK